MPSVSIVIPTFQEERNIGDCLHGIFTQEFPREKLQVIVIDGNSPDRTAAIAQECGAEVITCQLPNEDLKKPLAIRDHAWGEIIGLFDADNLIPNEPSWLQRMVEPFSDPSIWATDTLYFTFRENDTLITKYLALVGGDDPIASYLGVNDRYCYFTDKWTGAIHHEIDRGGFIEVELDPKQVPAIGSNGFFFRRSLFNEVPNDPFVHQVFAQEMVRRGHRKIAKVKQGVIHVQNGSFAGFLKKKIRRMERRRVGELHSDHDYGMSRAAMIRTGLYATSVILPVLDAIIGYRRRPTQAWWLHPLACLCLAWIYAWYTLRGIGPLSTRRKHQPSGV